MTRPTTAAASAASTGARGKGMPTPAVSLLRVNPATPAKAIWASEIWPR